MTRIQQQIQQQIKHIDTLQRYRKARHKRYRESTLAAAIDDLIKLAQANTPAPRRSIIKRIGDALAPVRWALACMADVRQGRRQ